MKARTPVLLLLLLLLPSCLEGTEDEVAKCNSKHPKLPLYLEHHDYIQGYCNKELDNIEFSEFCEQSLLDRSKGIGSNQKERCSVTLPYEFDMTIEGKMLFVLIMMITFGAIVRAVFHNFEIQFPYTVVLMLSGMAFGFIAKKHCEDMHEYTDIARVSAKIILFTFLPLLIFESAFSIPVHTFTRSAMQIILVAFPGMTMCTFMSAAVCWKYFRGEYNWSFMQAALFGCIVSATDPVAVVAILRELGVSEVLSVMIEGESLLNDGVAILLYEIFKEILEEEQSGEEGHTGLALVGHITKTFFQIAVGGPIFGWIMGKLVIFLLSYVFNDPPVEISATICAAYLTYWISEDVLHVSGVMAVVLLGVTMKAERTVISPDSEESVHHFWQIMGYLANTVLFCLVGIVLAITASKGLQWEDWFNLLILYIAIHVSRFIMLMLFYPILARIGYGLSWQSMIVMMWGGLRGAVGVCLALDVLRNDHFCHLPLVGPKMLFQTAGIVFLTLVVNGTTTKPLLSALRLTEITSGRKEDMANAVKRIQRLKSQAIRMFKLSPRMFDADWTLVNNFCTVHNPYQKTKAHVTAKNQKRKDLEELLKLNPPEPIKDNTTVCGHCRALVPNEPTTEEYIHLTEEARLKVIRSMKVAYTHRNGVGLLSDAALQILMNRAERMEDRTLQLLHANDFNRYTHQHGFYPWLEAKIIIFETRAAMHPTKPAASWRFPFWYLVSHEWFERFMMVVIIGNMVPVIWEIADSNSCDSWKEPLYKWVNVIFTVIFILELIINLLGHTAREYWCDAWTYLDWTVVILSVADCILTFIAKCKGDSKGNQASQILGFGVALRLCRISRALRLVKPALPKLHGKVHNRINDQLFQGFDIAREFIHASDEVVKFLPQMIENKKVCRVVREHVMKERMEAVKSLVALQKKNPEIAVALKTRYACRMVINAMSDSLHEAKDEGLLDDTEFGILTRIIELKIKRLWHSPTSIEPKYPLSDKMQQSLTEIEEESLKARESTTSLPPVAHPETNVLFFGKNKDKDGKDKDKDKKEEPEPPRPSIGASESSLKDKEEAAMSSQQQEKEKEKEAERTKSPTQQDVEKVKSSLRPEKVRSPTNQRVKSPPKRDAARVKSPTNQEPKKDDKPE